MSKEFELYESLLAKKRLMGLDDLYFFNKYVLEEDPERRKYLVPHVHGEWNTWYRHSKKRIKLILVPRACFKSTFFTVGRTLQALAQNRNHRILIANATLENAQRFLGEVKSHIRKNETYKTLYGDMYDKNNKWNESEMDIVGKNLGSREPSVTAAGVGGNLVSQHYSIIIADDLVNLENSATRYQADKVIDWWKRAFSLLDYDGEMIVIGTRWSYYELYSYMLDELEDSIDHYIRGAYKKDGSLYFPEMLDEEKLSELRGLQGSYVFSSFYLNDPVDEDSALIKKSQIKYWGTPQNPNDKVKPDNLNIFSVCDPAVSQATRADYSSIVTVGVDSDNNWYVLEVRRDKWTVAQLADELFHVKELWKPITMTIEVVGQAQGLLTPIYQEEERRGKYLSLVEIKTRNNVTKEMRIRSVLQPRFERGKIFIKKGMFDLEEELLKFPKSQHDDIIDPLTDIEEIAFSPEENSSRPDEPQSHLESLLIKQSKGEDKHIDPIMGEYF